MAMAMASVPHLSQLVDTIRELLYVTEDVYSLGSARAEFATYLKDVIFLLENVQHRLNHRDIERAQGLKRKLGSILQRMPSNKLSLFDRFRFRVGWLSNSWFIDETRREIDATLGLIGLNTMVSIRDRMDKLISKMEIEPNHDGGSLGVGGCACVCGLRMTTRPPPNLALTPQVATSILGKPNCSPGRGPAEPDNMGNTQGLSDPLHIAFRNVEHHRLLVRTTGLHKSCLANSLYLLAKLFKEAGMYREASACNQEAVELYLTVGQDLSNV